MCKVTAYITIDTYLHIQVHAYVWMIFFYNTFLFELFIVLFVYMFCVICHPNKIYEVIFSVWVLGCPTRHSIFRLSLGKLCSFYFLYFAVLLFLYFAILWFFAVFFWSILYFAVSYFNIFCISLFSYILLFSYEHFLF